MGDFLHRLAFIDETSLKTNMIKKTGWAPRGERLIDHAPHGHWNTQTFIAALRHDRLDAPWILKGAMDREMFDLYIETQLAPTLHKGDAGQICSDRAPGSDGSLLGLQSSSALVQGVLAVPGQLG